MLAVTAAPLTYGDPQVILGVVFAVLAVIVLIAFAVVARQAGTDVSFARVQRLGYWLRRRWLSLLVVLGALVVGISLLDLPYATGSSSQFKIVRVTSGQFFWTLVPNQVRVDTPVRFDVTSIDVNHGFGLYTPSGHFIGSVQAMPGFHNDLDLTLHQPGVYHIRCMELCGVGHSTMEGTLTVVK